MTTSLHTGITRVASLREGQNSVEMGVAKLNGGQARGIKVKTNIEKDPFDFMVIPKYL